MATLADRLRDWARDDTHNKAAVELLVEHDFWLRREGFVEAAVDRSAGVTRIYWHRAAEYAKNVDAPTQALAVLQIAALIGGDTARLATLDHAHRELVVKALTDALGVER